MTLARTFIPDRATADAVLSAGLADRGVGKESPLGWVYQLCIDRAFDCTGSEIEKQLLLSLILLNLAHCPFGIFVTDPLRNIEQDVPVYRVQLRDVIQETPSLRAWKKALFVTPQAGLPLVRTDGRAIRVDFAIWEIQNDDQPVIIECDGYKWHAGKKAFGADRERDRILQSAGYRVLRFSGEEIFADPTGAALNLDAAYFKVAHRARVTL
jgi:hypothetical protein